VKVLIADDHAVVRRGVREILKDSPLEFAADEVGSATDTIKAIRENSYDVVLLDISFPDGHGLDVLQQIHLLQPKTRVLFLTIYPEIQYARRALRLGADGYLTKDSAPAELITAIQHVIAGKKYISESLAENLADVLSLKVKGSTLEILSDREYQVLADLGAGKSIQEIATELNLSPKTISTYRSRLKEKLKLKTTADIIHYVIENHTEV
jgi:two-component system, NarL family, invasion response regulator UvrY